MSDGWKAENESDVCLKIERSLEKYQIRYLREVRTWCGRLDFLILEPLAIIEVKFSNDIQSLEMAVGQLMFYKISYSEAHLFIATNEPIYDYLKVVLDRCAIREWNIDEILLFKAENE